eukprot:TRINITY_DN7094_c0_g2_i4.p1 TRINITY_DN7094_c0_g2~~TRINITY_DN7094_c0_g2_i4.p1  ORF type:complete len:256 (+),score=67.22 TRINITY_DN7094_c0_g2_i4:301-1068(+)
MSALHYAAKYNNRKSVEGLITYRADPDRRNSDGESALDLAQRYNAADVAGFLARYKNALINKHTTGFTPRTRRAIGQMSAHASRSKNKGSQKHFWMTIDTHRSSKVHHLEGLVQGLRQQGSFRQCVVFVNHKRQVAPIVQMLSSMPGNTQISQLTSNIKTESFTAVEKAFGQSIEGRLPHVLVTVDHSHLFTDSCPLIINFDIPWQEPKAKYQERAGQSKQVISLINSTEAADKTAKKLITQLYASRGVTIEERF